MKKLSVLVGDKERFAIYVRLRQPIFFSLQGNFLYGYFAFYLGGDYVGDPLLDITVLPICYAYVVNYIYEPVNNTNDELFNMDKDDLFWLVGDGADGYGRVPPDYLSLKKVPLLSDETEEYFRGLHIEHMGSISTDMSFFIVLIKNSQGEERILWRNTELPDYHVKEIYLKPMEFENTIKEFETAFMTLCENTPGLDVGMDINDWCHYIRGPKYHNKKTL